MQIVEFPACDVAFGLPWLAGGEHLTVTVSLAVFGGSGPKCEDHREPGPDARSGSERCRSVMVASEAAVGGEVECARGGLPAAAAEVGTQDDG
ncbi:hypothetical protein [Actinocorallia herbida]|uniref:hypothetical protein n=1 Tax=Actinocorallia herbida TaxID=58109 RepID=UPI000F4C4ACD|nr:hypothetical protein [Actinocorallia herbida]